MIFIWIGYAFRFLLKLIIPPKEIVQRIDPKGPCVSCGNRGGLELKTIRVEKSSKVYVQCGCKVCCAVWFREPVSVPEIPAF